MSEYYPETRFVVCTANPDPELRPLACYEIEHGAFVTKEAAYKMVDHLLSKGQSVQVFKRRWIEFNEPNGWYNHESYPHNSPMPK